MAALKQDDRVAPVRGLIPLQNHRGDYYAREDILRWMRLNRYGFNTDKVDIFSRGPLSDALRRYLLYGRDLDLKGGTTNGRVKRQVVDGFG